MVWSTTNITYLPFFGLGVDRRFEMQVRRYADSELIIEVSEGRRGFCSFSFSLSERGNWIRNARVGIEQTHLFTSPLLFAWASVNFVFALGFLKKQKLASETKLPLRHAC
jgi:hypothetical protein